MVMLGSRRRGGVRVHGFWAGFLTFWLGYGVIYAIYRAGFDGDSKLGSVTLGTLAKLLLLVVLWPFDLLGAHLNL
jgi:hypothetical protein